MVSINSTKRRLSYVTLALVAVFVSLVISVPAFAAGIVSRGYTVTSDAKTGSLMARSGDNTETAELADATKEQQLLGIVTSESAIAIDSGEQQVQITSSGTVPTLVSDMNGEIKAGDSITSSPIPGVGMKATEAGQIVGIATGTLTDSSSRTITDKNGKDKEVQVGTVQVQVGVSTYSGGRDGDGNAAANSFLPPFIMDMARQINGGDISATRVLIALIILIVGFFIVAQMLSSGIKNGMISIGRNPLAKESIWHGIAEVGITAVGILIVTVVIVYLIVKL